MRRIADLRPGAGKAHADVELVLMSGNSRPAAAVAFYEAAFGATVLHRVGEGDAIVVQ